MKVIAIVPMKHHSSRVPGKNYRQLHHYPLYYYILDTLHQVPEINQIVVDTDSNLIIEGVSKHFPKITIYQRPKELQGDDISTNTLLQNVILDLNLEADYFLQTHCTNPFLSKEIVREILKTWEIIINNDDMDYDSLYTVKQLQTRLYDHLGKAINHNPTELIPTQNLVPIYEENSCVYLFTKESLFQVGTRIGQKPKQFLMNHYESHDIDTEYDFQMAMMMTQYRYQIEKEQRVVLITGVMGGIGKATAAKFYQSGWQVIGIDRKNPDTYLDLKHFLNRYIQLDISSPGATNILLQNIQQHEGRLDALINNAAVQICQPLNETSNADWQMVMQNNVQAVFELSKTIYPLLLKNNKGCIVNIASVHAIATSSGVGAYAASKGALHALTRVMALEYAPDGIRVNAVLPGAIETPMLVASLERNREDGVIGRKKLEERTPLKRIAKPWEIAETIYFLADNQKSSFVTGQSLIVDGGALAQLSTE